MLDGGYKRYRDRRVIGRDANVNVAIGGIGEPVEDPQTDTSILIIAVLSRK